MAAADSGRMTPGMLYVLWPMTMTALQPVAMVLSRMGKPAIRHWMIAARWLATIATCVQPIHWLEVPITARRHVNLTRWKCVRTMTAAAHRAAMRTMIMIVHRSVVTTLLRPVRTAMVTVSQRALMAISCTDDIRTGSSDSCDVACTFTDVTVCETGDGCCPSGCTFATDEDCPGICGNGVVETGEECDDGDTIDTGNGCTSQCRKNSVCGDGIVQSVFEACDDGLQMLVVAVMPIARGRVRSA